MPENPYDSYDRAALLSLGIDVDVRVSAGQREAGLTPICFAALSGQTEVVQELIRRNANVDESHGISALSIAISKKDSKYNGIIEALCRAKGELDLQEQLK